jgi:hypothetical protein
LAPVHWATDDYHFAPRSLLSLAEYRMDDYKEGTLSLGFADGMTIEIHGREASHPRRLLEDALSIKLRGLGNG